jgi:hexokinase
MRSQSSGSDVLVQTVGALLSRSYTAGGCLLGAIFGTGTNGAYVEDLSKLTKLKDEALKSSGGKMIVNTEWGAFNNSVCPRCRLFIRYLIKFKGRHCP